MLRRTLVHLRHRGCEKVAVMVELILAVVLLLAIGFASGYAVRSHISMRRRRRDRLENGL